jgi:hypothetical protein
MEAGFLSVYFSRDDVHPTTFIEMPILYVPEISTASHYEPEIPTASHYKFKN